MFAKFFDKLSTLRPRQLLAIAAGLAVLVFAVFYFTITMLTKNNVAEEEKPVEEQPPAEIQMKNVVVATRNIEPKVMLTAKMLEVKELPVDSVPVDAVTDITEIVNLPTRAKIFKGDVMTAQKVYKNLEQAGFVGSIPPDCRAVSVNINDVTGVAGFAKPGDYVDVLLVERDEGLVTSSILLQNVLLLSINSDMGVNPPPENEDSDAPVNPAAEAIENPAIATLALKPDDVLQLVSASQIGEIYLMLRPLRPQSERVYSTDYTVQSLKSQRLQQEKQDKPVVAPQEPVTLTPPVRTVDENKPEPEPEDIGFEIIYGNK